MQRHNARYRVTAVTGHLAGTIRLGREIGATYQGPTATWFVDDQARYVDPADATSRVDVDYVGRRVDQDEAMENVHAEAPPLPGMIDMLGDIPLFHGERGDDDPEHPYACFCGYHYFLWCPDYINGGHLGSLVIGGPDDPLSCDGASDEP